MLAVPVTDDASSDVLHITSLKSVNDPLFVDAIFVVAEVGPVLLNTWWCQTASKKIRIKIKINALPKLFGHHGGNEFFR